MARSQETLNREIEKLVAGAHHDPHSLLGLHHETNGVFLRALHPGASEITALVDGQRVALEKIHPAGVFESAVKAETTHYLLEIKAGDLTITIEDPYRFLPVPGSFDLHLFAEGKHHALWKILGAHVMEHQGVEGTAFAVWAPNARAVRVVGDFNSWDGRIHPMRSLGASGIWELFVPGVRTGAKYKFELITAQGNLTIKTDPFAFEMEPPPRTEAVITSTRYEWSDQEWIEARRNSNLLTAPVSIYECHLGSWLAPVEGETITYRESAHRLADYATSLGFTHIEFLPVAEHPFGGSWGYQVSAYFAPTARFGSPDDFRYLVDVLHGRGIGIIIDWVPAHFPRDEFALARFDGTALYEHLDPKRGEHPDWGTLIFNFNRNEVRNFLLANALYWIEEFHIDGLRVDAVASMLYLDYSRKEGEWIPNQFGGRENLEAIDFLKELNIQIHGYYPGVITIAEESTAWPGVSKPTYAGGLGFTFKWNMGWMHDTLDYFSREPVHRKYHHNQLTFGLLYAFHENFVLPLSHDEVVHGKGSLLTKMPGDRWQQMANLRSLLAWMWAHPGKQLVFMGGEIAQEREWSHDRTLDWQVLEWDQHRGVQELVKTMNALYRDEPSLWELDFSPEGFQWIDANDSDQNVFSFLRYSAEGKRKLACIANLSPLPRTSYRVGLPEAGRWRELMSTDEVRFGGSGIGGDVAHDTSPSPWHGLEHSTELFLPPLGVIWLVPA